jgi:fused signal recognition particle receptor
MSSSDDPSNNAANEASIVVALPGGFGRQKQGWFQRLSTGLGKSSTRLAEQVASVLTKSRLDQDDLDALEEMLIEADLGAGAASRITAAFAKARFGREADEIEVKEALAEAIASELRRHEARFEPLGGAKPYVVLFVGVNGSGKTTTLGKIAAELQGRGARVLIAAGDTFRAAAIEQLQVWAQRSGAAFMSRPPGADAAGLAFDAVAKGRAEGFDVVLIDTAGRLQNKSGLMDELAKVIRVLRKMDPSLPNETLLVLDATVGRNALSQAEIFGKTAGVTGLVMTKLDGTARGGVLLAAAEAGNAPIKLIGVGEGVDDLQPFDAVAFSRSLVGLDEAKA